MPYTSEDSLIDMWNSGDPEQREHWLRKAGIQPSQDVLHMVWDELPFAIMDQMLEISNAFDANEGITFANEATIERSNGRITIDGQNVIQVWESFGGWYWYAVEDQGSYQYDDVDGTEKTAHAWYGYVQGSSNEWGTWDSNELERSGRVWKVPKSNWSYTGRESISNENWEDMELAGYNWEFTDDNANVIRCRKCGKTFNIGFYPRRGAGYDSIEREAQAHEMAHLPMNNLFNENGSCKLCGQEVTNYERHLQSTHGITWLGESLAEETDGYCPDGQLFDSVKRECVDADKPTPTLYPLEWYNKSEEAHIWGSWFSDNFKEEYTMDQDGTYRCKHCDAWFDEYGSYGSHSPEVVAKHHLKTEHGIEV